jgi:hypothetical protein
MFSRRSSASRAGSSCSATEGVVEAMGSLMLPSSQAAPRDDEVVPRL